MKREVKKVQTHEKILIPYNENTKHIYDTYSAIAMNIIRRKQAENGMINEQKQGAGL